MNETILLIFFFLFFYHLIKDRSHLEERRDNSVTFTPSFRYIAMDGDKTPINNDSLSAGSSDGTASTVEDEKKTKETTGSGGHDNPAFEVDEKKSNASTSSSSQHEDNSATTVNLELVDLTPPKMSPKSAKSMAAEDAIDADVEKGKKKEKDNLDYFVPVNEHKKGVR